MTTVPFLITADQLKVLTDTITQNINALLPVGLTIMAIFVGLSLIRRVFYTFF